MSQDFARLTEDSHEMYGKYSGKWIAVLDGRVIGVGETATEAARQADAEHPGADYILKAVDPEPDRI